MSQQVIVKISFYFKEIGCICWQHTSSKPSHFRKSSNYKIGVGGWPATFYHCNCVSRTERFRNLACMLSWCNILDVKIFLHLNEGKTKATVFEPSLGKGKPHLNCVQINSYIKTIVNNVGVLVQNATARFLTGVRKREHVTLHIFNASELVASAL